ncbi:MAG TPA: deoxyribonuclease IV [Acholeplasma sp.]|jgi:deoxyribonuclease-4|nr:deoxyribonuclease IV [Acholeplasma sp.]
MIKLGSHVSNKGDEMLVGSVLEAASYNANCFMVYLGAPQNSYRKSFASFRKDEFDQLLKEHQMNIDDIIVHAPYIINMANPDPEKREFAINFLTSELLLMEQLGFTKIVVHPGNSLGDEQAINYLKESLIKLLDNTKDTKTMILLETMAGKGTEIGRNFQELAFLLEGLPKERVNVCFDTCHTFDSGYDTVNDYDGVLREFDEVIGLERIKAIHLNDSKNPIGSKKDRHENIGYGYIGFETLLKFVYDERFKEIPKILETPYIDGKAPYKEEIEMIKMKKFNPKLKGEH